MSTLDARAAILSNDYSLHKSSGCFAAMAAIRRASSRVSSLAAEHLREWGVPDTHRRDARTSGSNLTFGALV
jgi:hypothetical protein